LFRSARCSLLAGVLTALFAASAVAGGQASGSAGLPYTIVSPEGRAPLAVTVVAGEDMVSLDDLAARFQLTVREDAAAGGLVIAAESRTLVVSLGRPLASSSGRLVSLPAPPSRSGRTWLVPIELVGRGLPLILDLRIELRRTSRLVLVGDVRAVRVTMRHESTGPGQARVTLDVRPRAESSVEFEGGRILVRYQADVLEGDADSIPPSDLISGVRVNEPPMSVALVTGPRYASYRAASVPVDASSGRVVIDISGTGPAPGTPAPLPAPPPRPEPPPLVFAQPTSAVRTIVLDPGHGGEEEGARGPGGTLEKDVVLAVARQLRGALEARLGVRVLLTRDADQTVAHDDRAALANNNKADLFISLHANASVRSSAAGAEVFYLSADDYARAADRPSGELPMTLPVAGGGERQIEMVLWEMAQVRHLEDSATLARIIEEQLRARVPMSPRAIQQAPFRVLVGANMPAALVEMGFISNPEEEQRLASAPHQALLVNALVESIVQVRAWIESGRPAREPASRVPPQGPR
jgi:N-acetylmuramoyl-L-alanine amidase